MAKKRKSEAKLMIPKGMTEAEREEIKKTNFAYRPNNKELIIIAPFPIPFSFGCKSDGWDDEWDIIPNE